MGIWKDIRQYFAGHDDRMLHTRYGDFNLAKEGDRRKVRKMVVNLQRTTDALTRKDIQDWRNAWQLAINVDSPNRKPLYDIYRDVDADLHLSGCIEQRKGFVMSRSFKIVGADGKEVEDAAHYFNQAWFRQLMKLSLDSVYWGHSLIELGDIVTDGDGCICYDGVKLIPRKHVIPEYGRVVTDLGQDWTTGLEYRRAPFTDWLIEAGQPDDLGLFLKAATQTIPKKNALAFWDTFAEIFGMPMRIAKTTTRDEKELAKMEKREGTGQDGKDDGQHGGKPLGSVPGRHGDRGRGKHQGRRIQRVRQARGQGELRTVQAHHRTDHDHRGRLQPVAVADAPRSVREPRGKRPHHAGRHREQPAHPAHG